MHRKLRRLGAPVETTKVSSLVWSAGDYVGPPDHVENALRDITQDGIVHQRSLRSTYDTAKWALTDALVERLASGWQDRRAHEELSAGAVASADGNSSSGYEGHPA